jgi:hypothetical protein
MRHLDRTLVALVLKRGKSVENFAGRVPGMKVPSIRYVELRPANGAIQVWVHDLEDCGHEQFTDLVEFPRLNAEASHEPRAVFQDAEAAIQFAETNLGVTAHRWTNVTVGHDDYLDFVRAGRPQTWPVA